MYISILDYVEAKVVIVKVHDGVDAETYVGETFGLDNVEWMASDSINLEIKSDL